MARLALPLVLAILAGGCGGSKAAKPPLSAKDFRVQANRICAQTKTHAARLSRLRKLRPPAADEDLYSRWLKAERDAIEAAKPAAETTGQPLFDDRIPLTIAEGKIAGYARRLGATRCTYGQRAQSPP